MQPPKDLPFWLQDDDIDSSTLLEVVMNDGSRFTATIGDISDDWLRMQWNVVTERTTRRRPARTMVVPIKSVVSAQPVSEPLSDPQLPAGSDSIDRGPLNVSTFTVQSGVLFAAGFAIMIGIVMTHDWWVPAHWQALAAVAYTTVILVGTFASVKFGSVLPEIPFTRPQVRTNLPRLALIHVGFLAACLVLVTFAIAIHPALPAWVNVNIGRGTTLFTFVIALALFAFIGKHVSMNRRLLEGASVTLANA